MDKNVLKSFAVEARKELIKKIEVKALQYGISTDTIKGSNISSSDSIIIQGKALSTNEKIQRELLIKEIRGINESGEDGYKHVLEEVAYTWFNRFVALRFMEVNNYLPTRTRALSSSTPGSVEPDLVKEAATVDMPIDKQTVYSMKLSNDMEGLFKYVIIAQCNALNQPLPFMFETIGHYTELLFPSGMLSDGAFVRNLTDTNLIPEEDWQDVEIIGWLYQYYISEEKDRVIKAKKQYKKDEIPFATQLFTPDWIVRYMVQNSLGRYWIESHPEHNDLKEKWEFYLENPNPEPDLEEKLAPYINKDMKVENIKCFDPACGSGHILVYMFEVLYQIYEKCGYMPREIPKLIIENNLYGLDIDDRAYQLACFAVVMKGMHYNNQLLRSMKRDDIRLNIASVQETNHLNGDDIGYIAGEESGANFEKTKVLIEKFRNAKIYGSLIKVEEFDEEFFEQRLDYIMNTPAEDLMQEVCRTKAVVILPEIIKQVRIMSSTYDVLGTNPPYMGSKYMNPILAKFIKDNYLETKSDLFSAFIEYCMRRVKNNGQLGFLTPFVWMFISSYEKLRKRVVEQKNISSLIQLEYNAFPEACVPVCTFTLRNYNVNISGEYIKLSDFTGSDNQSIKTLEAMENHEVYYRYTTTSKNFAKITGSPIAYWSSDRIRRIFKEQFPLSKFAEPRKGLDTGNNDLFLRRWHEVEYTKIGFKCLDMELAKQSERKWFPCQKGGSFRRWYGNHEFIIDWENNGERIKFYPKSNIRNESYYFRPGITWSTLSSYKLSLRYSPNGFLFESKGSICFPRNDSNLFYLLACLNSKVISLLINMISPTLDYHEGPLGRLPILIENKERIEELSVENIETTKKDWDNFENSWDFTRNPLIIHKNTNINIEQAFNSWLIFTKAQFKKLKNNEEEINRIFIDIYGLQDELTPEVVEKDVIIRKADKERDIKSFISYAVGCMFGRYSLDQEGLIYAGGEFNISQYDTFLADVDNIIPIIADSYFADDIVDNFVEFVKVTFLEETLVENLEFIAETLGKKNNETAKETIRRYFLNDFFKDHIKVYRNRPIYWLFTSGKQKAFNCLIYMHRYDKTTLSRIRTDYLHELQDRLNTERKSLVDVIDGDYNIKEKKDANKRLSILDKQIEELKKYDEVLHHMADKQIEIDLDDGVVVNYEKFKGLLAKI